MEIVSSLSSSPITRLKRTWKLLDESVDPETGSKYTEIYQKLTQVVSHEKSFTKLRESLKNIEPPCIPYVGLYLTDLTFIDVGNKDLLQSKTGCQLHNFEKRVSSANIIKEVILFQDSSYTFTPVPLLQTMIMFAKFIDDEEAYKTSVMVEPKIESK